MVQFRTEDTKHKELSKKQKLWIERNRILCRLKGMPSINLNTNALTGTEKYRLDIAFTIIRGITYDSVASSIELGFNAKPRCKACGSKIGKDGKCEICGESTYQIHRPYDDL